MEFLEGPFTVSAHYALVACHTELSAGASVLNLWWLRVLLTRVELIMRHCSYNLGELSRWQCKNLTISE